MKTSILHYTFFIILSLIVLYGVSDLLQSGRISQTRDEYEREIKYTETEKKRVDNQKELDKRKKVIPPHITDKLKSKSKEPLSFVRGFNTGYHVDDASKYIDYNRLTQTGLMFVLADNDDKISDFIVHLVEAKNITSQQEITDIVTDYIIVEGYRQYGD